MLFPQRVVRCGHLGSSNRQTGCRYTSVTCNPLPLHFAAPSERYEVVIDFSAFEVGTVLHLDNPNGQDSPLPNPMFCYRCGRAHGEVIAVPPKAGEGMAAELHVLLQVYDLGAEMSGHGKLCSCTQMRIPRFAHVHICACCAGRG